LWYRLYKDSGDPAVPFELIDTTRTIVAKLYARFWIGIDALEDRGHELFASAGTALLRGLMIGFNNIAGTSADVGVQIHGLSSENRSHLQGSL
jgi:hypothetical protein